MTTTAAPSSNGRSISNGYASGSNLYTSGQCTYYVFDRVGGKIGSTWGNASNWASAAASSGYTVNNTPKAGAIMQTTQGYYGHVAYVEGVNSNGSVRVSEMNYDMVLVWLHLVQFQQTKQVHIISFINQM
ncbi:Secretory antigen precursor SsaA [Staphylococcus aureus]|nr:Secretory antigen precursor SsaA [Staphylococcus aureus]